MGRAGLEKEPRQVAAMFDDVAERYDRTNTILSARPGPPLASAHRPRAAAAAGAEGAGRRRRDRGVHRRRSSATGAWCVATDFSIGMLSAARRTSRLPRVAGDALAPAVRRRHLRLR